MKCKLFLIIIWWNIYDYKWWEIRFNHDQLKPFCGWLKTIDKAPIVEKLSGWIEVENEIVAIDDCFNRDLL